MRLRLVAASLMALSFPALAADDGTRVFIQLPKERGELPDAEKMVESLVVLGGGERRVRVKQLVKETVAEVTLDLWAPTPPAQEIPGLLRESFPVLATAEIQVSTLEASSRPKHDESEGEPTVKGPDGKVRKIIKKKIVEAKER
jgi:hypothetical protein